MKIVVTGTRGIPNIMGGVETHCEELFPRIVAKGYDVTVIRRKSYVTPSPQSDGLPPSGRGANGLVWKGVKLVDVETPKKKSFEAIIHTFRAINKAKRLGADVVHINAIGPALLVPYAKLLGMKVVFTHHGPDYDRDKWGFAAKTMLKLGESMGCKFADHVIVISDVIKRLIAERCGRTKNVHLIYNGVPEPEICDYPEYFEELGIEKGKYILGMCRFVPEKHLHDLVEAFAQMKSHTDNTENTDLRPLASDIKLVLAGDTDFEDDYSRGLKQKARENGVVLTGFIRGKKLHSLLTNAMCYSLPSSHEGLPIALLEAMSYRLPVITSAIPANLEVGLDESCYHKVGDVDTLALKIAAIANKPLQRIDYDMSKYNWDNIADQVAEIYQSLSKE